MIMATCVKPIAYKVFMQIKEKVNDFGGGFVTVKRAIDYNNGNDENSLMIDFQDGKIIGASYDFGGVLSMGGGYYKVEELARFKALLNSFTEL